MMVRFAWSLFGARRHFSSCRHWPIVLIALFTTIHAGLMGRVRAADSQVCVLTLIDRTVTQDQGAWILNYRLRYSGTTGLVLIPEEFAVRVDGWVSNSRVPSHTVPRWSSIQVARMLDLSASAEIIPAADELQKCRERLIVSVWPASDTSSKKAIRHRTLVSTATSMPNPSADFPMAAPFSLGPSDVVHVRLRLEHQHIVYGDLDPLLAERDVELKLGQHVIRDRVPLDREHYLAYPKSGWPEPAIDRRDTRHYVSGPDSLHLESHIPGHPYYRYPARPVRYSTRMRLHFWYLIAVGTEGECGMRIAQYRDTPDSWLKLDAAGFEMTLKTIGRWTEIERIIQTDSQATSLALEFKIVGDTDIGEMWIDDVNLEVVNNSSSVGP